MCVGSTVTGNPHEQGGMDFQSHGPCLVFPITGLFFRMTGLLITFSWTKLQGWVCVSAQEAMLSYKAEDFYNEIVTAIVTCFWTAATPHPIRNKKNMMSFSIYLSCFATVWRFYTVYILSNIQWIWIISWMRSQSCHSDSVPASTPEGIYTWGQMVLWELICFSIIQLHRHHPSEYIIYQIWSWMLRIQGHMRYRAQYYEWAAVILHRQDMLSL